MRLSEEVCATLRRVFADPVVGFASYDGLIEPLSATDFKVTTSLIVHCSASVEICCGEVEIYWGDDAYPWIYYPMSAEARVWPTEPWSIRGIERIDPPGDVGLDLMTPLGQVVEIHVLSVVIPASDPGETTIELDTALVLKVGGWRLLIESIEHTDYDWLGPDLVLTTDPDTIDERLSHGAVRELDQPRLT